MIPSLGRCRERVNSCRHEVSRDELPSLIYFHEYFHGDNGAGIGASHRLHGLDSLPSSLNKAARKGKLANPKSGL